MASVEISESEILPKGFDGDWKSHSKLVAHRRETSGLVGVLDHQYEAVFKKLTAAKSELAEAEKRLWAARKEERRIAELIASHAPIVDRLLSIPDCEDLLEQASVHFGISADDITGNLRDKRFTSARQELYWVGRRKAKITYPIMGDLFRRDHTTILYGVRKFQKKLDAGTVEEPTWWSLGASREGNR